MTQWQAIMVLVLALYIWFDTPAFIEWARFLRFKFIYKGFDEARATGVGQKMIHNYTDYLAFKHGQNFFAKILCCSICLTVWLVIGVCFVTGWWADLAAISVFSLVGYNGLHWFVKKTNE